MWTLGLRNLRGEVGRNMRAEYDGRLKVGGIKNEKGSFGGSG